VANFCVEDIAFAEGKSQLPRAKKSSLELLIGRLGPFFPESGVEALTYEDRPLKKPIATNLIDHATMGYE